MSEFPEPASELFDALVTFGRTSDPAMAQPLSELYRRTMALVGPQTRLTMLAKLTDLAEVRELSIDAFIPFLFGDNDPGVVSTAALYMAVLHPDSEDDPLRGVRVLSDRARQFVERGDEPRAAAILSGLLLLGDRRVTTLLQNCWRWLSKDGRIRLSRMNSGALHAPVIDWFIDWLADCEQGDFGAVAGALTRISQMARGQEVVEVERVLPCWLAADGQPVRLLQRWTFAEFGERIRPRLEEIARHESDPPLMPQVLEAWRLGLYERPPATRASAPDIPAGHARRDVLALVPGNSLERSQNFTPFPVSEAELVASGGDLVLCWGIFNPYGPTLSCFGRLHTSRPDVDLLFYRMLNPFRQDAFVVGSLVGADRADAAAIGRMLGARFSDNWVATMGAEPVYLVGDGAPTFIVRAWEDLSFRGEVQNMFMTSPAIRGCELAADIDYLQRYPRRPWDRTAEQRDKGFAAFLETAKSNQPPKLAPEGPPATAETVQQWYDMVTAQDHYIVELACFPDAWSGAIEHCSTPELQQTAYSMERVNRFLSAFDFPIFQAIADARRKRP